MIAASYASELICRMNRDVQRIMDNPMYRQIFEGVGLYGKNIRTSATGSFLRNSDIFEIVDHSGVYRSAGVGGGITGMGGDILNIDDPVKDYQEAQSPTVRQAVWDWYTSTAYTRLSPGGGVLLTMTRWHKDDLAGRLLRRMSEGDGDQWEVISFPAIATHDESHRKEGEPLHPERWNLEYLRQIKATLGSFQWSALYQQSPMADGGNIFKEEWLQFYHPHELPERFDECLQSWDMAFKEKEDSDFVVGQVWGRKNANLYLLDQVRARLSFTGTAQAVVELSRKWPGAHLKLIEDKANGPAVMDSLKDAVSGFRPVEPYGNKVARAHAVTPTWESGNVYLPHPSIASWVRGFIDELVGFPAEAYDDQVDAMTQAVKELHGSPMAIWDKYLS
jgi:predicted phage terminase large subunit-like protein